MTTPTNIKIHVTGRVQGVGFRYFTFQQARKLNLCGYVRNLDDGRVEIVASGKQADIDDLIHWLQQGGPPSAKIERYSVQPTDNGPYDKFDIKR
jgi:acylphosphatase